MGVLRPAMCFGALVCALFSAPSFSGPLIPIPTERVTWGIDGILNATFPLGGTSLSANAGDPFSIDLEFELDTVWTQCSPCISVGDREWRGKITDFNLTIGGTELDAIIDGILPNFVVVRPGDDASEADQTSLRLGSNSASSVQSPFQFRHQGDIFDAAFSLYISDYSSALFGAGPQSWLHPSVPTGNVRAGPGDSRFVIFTKVNGRR